MYIVKLNFRFFCIHIFYISVWIIFSSTVMIYLYGSRPYFSILKKMRFYTRQFRQFISTLQLLQERVICPLAAKCGYVKARLFENKLFSSDEYEALKEKVIAKAHCIFNEKVDNSVNDRKRKQLNIDSKMYGRFPALRQLEQALRHAFIESCGEKMFLEGTVVLALPGAKPQEPHCDYPFDLDNPLHFSCKITDEAKRALLRAKMHENARKSFFFFYALDENTTLTVLDPDGGLKIIDVEPGEAIIASGFLIHGGSGLIDFFLKIIINVFFFKFVYILSSCRLF